MQPRISMITLGVDDIQRSIAFYANGLQLPRLDFPSPDVAFFTLRGTWLGLFGVTALAQDAGVAPTPMTGFHGQSLAHNLPSREEVDALMQQAQAAGARITKVAEETFWGGYSGYFADPDGHLWEVAHNPFMWVGPVQDYEQPVAVQGWQGAQLPQHEVISGSYCQLEPLDSARHGSTLYRAFAGDDELWRFLPYGPFAGEQRLLQHLDKQAASKDPLWFAVSVAGEAVGVITLMRIHSEAGSIETGHLCFSASLQHSCAATEAIYLLAEYVFSLGFRRFEWKCNARNQASRSAALRFGFSYEGVFRNALVVKGYNRDTAWYAMTDDDWKKLQPLYQQWLDAGNFTSAGVQKTSLSGSTRQVLVQTG